MPTSETTITIEHALAELREMFPKGHLRAEVSATKADTDDDPHAESSSYAAITISRASERGAKSFRGLTLDQLRRASADMEGISKQ